MKKAKIEPANDWENPAVFGRNKRRAHVPLRSFGDPDSALQYFTGESKESLDCARIKTLSQTDWRFHLAGNPKQVPTDFASSDFDDQAWAKVCPVRRDLISKHLQPGKFVLTFAFPCSYQCQVIGSVMATTSLFTPTSRIHGRSTRPLCQTTIQLDVIV